MKKNMRLLFSAICATFIAVAFSSCVSTSTGGFSSITFQGTMDLDYGYEDIPWGSGVELFDSYTLKNKKIYTCDIGSGANKYRISFYKEDSESYDKPVVAYTCTQNKNNSSARIFNFVKNRSSVYNNIELFFVTEIIDYATATLEYLEGRFGDLTEVKNSGGTRVYWGGVNPYDPAIKNCIITIDDNNRSVTAGIYDSNLLSKLRKTSDKEWNVITDYDAANQVIYYTFLRNGTEDRQLFVGYDRHLENPVNSIVRSGFVWGNNTSGKYDIKTGSEMLNRDLDSAYWSKEGGWFGKSNDIRFAYNKASARDLLSVFLKGEKISVRHNNVISEFDASGLAESIAAHGITSEELDFALSNEEF